LDIREDEDETHLAIQGMFLDLHLPGSDGPTPDSQISTSPHLDNFCPCVDMWGLLGLLGLGISTPSRQTGIWCGSKRHTVRR
jgi:hypothetical protein